MDRVRLGRALGFGARAAAKTLVQAADAAMSPNPNPAAKSSAAANSNSAPKPTPTPAPTATSPARSSVPRAGNVVTATGRMGRAVFEPVKRHSRELWLQVTGSFFALLAIAMGSGMWAMRIPVRTALQAAHTNRAALWNPSMLKFYVAAAAVLMFAYFAITNFVRASRSSAAARR